MDRRTVLSTLFKVLIPVWHCNPSASWREKGGTSMVFSCTQLQFNTAEVSLQCWTYWEQNREGRNAGFEGFFADVWAEVLLHKPMVRRSWHDAKVDQWAITTANSIELCIMQQPTWMICTPYIAYMWLSKPVNITILPPTYYNTACPIAHNLAIEWKTTLSN